MHISSRYLRQIFFIFFLSLNFTASADPAAEALKELDGNWYSQQWKYGYTLKNGVGIATSTNSPNFKVGDVIIRLKPTSHTTYEGEQVYTDGKFYKVTVELAGPDQLQFSGEKNANWKMARVSTASVSAQPKSAPPASTGQMSEQTKAVLNIMNTSAKCAGFYSKWLPVSTPNSCAAFDRAAPMSSEWMNEGPNCFARLTDRWHREALGGKGMDKNTLAQVQAREGEYRQLYAQGKAEVGSPATSQVCKAYVERMVSGK